MEQTVEQGSTNIKGGGMIEVVGTNDRVWLTVAQVRVGLTPDAAAQLSVALRDAATAIMGSGEIVEGEILGAPV